MIHRPGPPKSSAAILPAIGMLLTAHLGLICIVKVSHGIEAEVLWLSHIGLALAAAGCLVKSMRLVRIALLCIGLPHFFWLFDCVVGFAFGGRFPLGITAYLQQCDAWGWAATAHHFYLLPLLLFLYWRQSGEAISRHEIVSAATLCALLTVVSRCVLPAEINVNQAHRMLPRVDQPILHWINDLPPALYLCALNAMIIVLLIVPMAFGLQRMGLKSNASVISNK